MNSLVIKWCLALSVLVTAVSGSVPAHAEMRLSKLAPIKVEEIHIRNLQKYAGKTLHVFYVSGREATLGVDGQTLNIKEVKTDPVRITIDGRGEAKVPKIEFPRTGFHVFNYVVFAVTRSDLSRLYLRNADGSQPAEAGTVRESRTSDADFRYERIGFISARALVNMTRAGVADLDSSKDF